MKQVIVVRTDLGMSVGKLAAQACHASVAAALTAPPQDLGEWAAQGQTKIILQGLSLEELLRLKDHCESLSLTHALISDAGHTELTAGTVTALGIGPAAENLIDKVTGSLPLLR